MRSWGLFLFACLMAWAVRAQQGPALTRVLFIYDGSNSMNKKWESGTKHDVAKKLLQESLDSLQNVPNLELALRVYGHQSHFQHGQDCDDTKLEVSFGKNRAEEIQRTLDVIRPKGTTPIAKTLEKAGSDFPRCASCRNIIILITDGIEECNGDPCAVSRALQKRGIILKPFIIGVGLDENFMETFKCVGNYFDASNEDVFRNVLNIVISQALNSTTAQVNLLDESTQPTETNVPYLFINRGTGEDEINHVHTMNHAGVPDTIYVDPSSTYDLTVFTLPSIQKTEVSVVPGKHTIIPVSAGQGSLELKPSGSIVKDQPVAIVRKAGQMTTLNVQPLRSTQKYLVGKYDLEILTLPRTYVYDVEIAQSKTTTIELPPPGIATIMRNTAGYGAIFQLDGDEINWVINLNENARNESIKLQPGRYKVVFRPRAAHDSKFSRVKEFSVSPGASVSVKLY